MNFKKMALSILIIFAMISFSSQAQSQETSETFTAQTGNLGEKIFAFGLGVGGVTSPGMFAGKINIDYLIDDMFSIGPYIQGGMKSDYNIIVVSIDGKFRYSFPGIPDQVKLIGMAGLGYLLRDMPLFNDHDFTARAGLGAEYFFTDYISLGLEASLNITSASTDRIFANFILGVHYFI